MAEILKGAPVTEALTERSKKEVEELKVKGVEPCLAILRVGERPDDIAYEKGAVKKAEAVGVKVRKVILPGDVSGRGAGGGFVPPDVPVKEGDFL